MSRCQNGEANQQCDPISVLLPGPRFISQDRKFQDYPGELNLELFMALQKLEAKNMEHIPIHVFTH